VITLLLSGESKPYGDQQITHLAHALQCATLAESQGASPELITACLLHDLGCLISGGETADFHEYRALGILQTLFSQAVTEPIRLHCEAKRYLCQVEPDYYHCLSAAAQADLHAQGGILSAAGALVFREKPFALEAIQLRQWDDRAQISGVITAGLEHFLPILMGCLVSNGTVRS
jgi:predicted HD phosphohydrolase